LIYQNQRVERGLVVGAADQLKPIYYLSYCLLSVEFLLS